MLEKIGNEISENIKKAYSIGQVDAKKIKNIVEVAISDVLETTQDSATNINKISQKAVASAITELKTAKDATNEKVEAVIEGTISGLSKDSQEQINKIDMELLKTKYRLQEHQDMLTANLKDALDGAKEVASSFSHEIKIDIEDAITHTKLKSANILGLMQETVKQSVKTVITEGIDVEEKISHITKDATINALGDARLSAKKVKEISESVVSEAINASKELEKELEATAQGAINGVKQGVTNRVEKAKIKLSTIQDDTLEFVEEEIQETIENLEKIEDSFIEALNNVSSKTTKATRDVIDENIKNLRETTSDLRIKAIEASEIAIDKLKEKGTILAYSAKEKAIETTETVKEEIKDLSEKVLDITKGALSGMLNEVKKVINKDNEK